MFAIVAWHGRGSETPKAGLSIDRVAPGELTSVSHVQSDNPDPKINFRRTPTEGRWREDQNDNQLFSLPGPLRVTVRCISKDANVDLSDRDSRSWYYVTAAEGPYPGVSGFVFGLLVQQPGPAPACDDAILAQYPFKPGRLTLTQGEPAAQGGYYYSIALRGFASNHTYRVGCYDDADPEVRPEQTVPFREFDLRTDQNGNAGSDRGCRSGEGSRYWVEVGPYSSDFVSWTAAPAKATPKAPAPPTPNDGLTTSVPPPPQQNQAPPPPPPPHSPSRTIVVQNQVTNGATGMREDSSQAYLSTQTAPKCRLNGCMIPNTWLSTGDSLTAICWTNGQEMTNGMRYDPVDDGNPGLVTSALWYRARAAGGPEGWISEVYIRADDRGGLGLPSC
ncbi:hypothetical protein ACLQ3B_04775 [Micromonospora sp. DT53]|uniref:hypothetical protein n=1 Tax=Micromonospora sp. DT53 TaxID=3393444 RepID=UPI003CECC703